jgi:hypothetical protein
MSQGASSGHGLDDFLSKIIERYTDIKTIVMCSAEGNELISGKLGPDSHSLTHSLTHFSPIKCMNILIDSKFFCAVC